MFPLGSKIKKKTTFTEASSWAYDAVQNIESIRVLCWLHK